MTRRISIYLLLLILAFAGSTSAQGLARLLPAETFLALGTQDLLSNSGKIDTFIDEFERLGVTEALITLLADNAADSEIGTVLGESLPGALEGLDILDLVGREAWLAVSVSSFNPLPAITLVARTSPAATSAFASLISEAAGSEMVRVSSEGGLPFYIQRFESTDTPLNGLAYAQAEDILMLSSNPDALRAVLRQLAGSNDPGFGSSEGYTGTLAKLPEGNFYGYIDYSQIADVVEPLAKGFGFDQLVGRFVQALDTAGSSGGVVSLTESGIESQHIQALNGSGKDLALYLLLSSSFPASRTPLSFAPETALSFTSSRIDLSGWWNYLNDLAGSTPELGGDLDDLLSIFVGVDLRSTFFSWSGTQVTTITTGLADVTEPGLPSSNLLGEVVYLIETFDEEAARRGLSQLFSSVSAGIASFADPMGGSGNASTTTHVVAGTEVVSYDIASGLSLSYAISDGFVLIATSQDAMATVLHAKQNGAGLQPGLERLKAEIPDNVSSFTLSDDRASLEGTARQLTSQLQLVSGLSGAANLDFDAVSQASGAVETFMQFIAMRLGGTVSYTLKRDGSVISFGKTEVSW
ncbi:MAG: hypothetical protein JSV66_16345 [Trueperaceae bacterium]|nr:MAG: hypothetical protein JSV66_16345 [Trueperaceae bacterium]